MKYHQLKANPTKQPKRLGRGIAGGQGKTAGRGTKGQNSRAGGGVRPGFEGGQTPLMQRLPKLRGFHSHKKHPQVIYTADLNQLEAGIVDNLALTKGGLVATPHSIVKLILNGALNKKFQVKLQAASQGAQTAIKKAGGSFTATPQIKQTAKDKSKKKLAEPS